ncbi:MBOAT family O-acyltransferase [Pseudanabaena sp. PCC 6802]|uniref:MBOAT family O-acyltransferase n=1 Tax=Pseudanabaena sp. PCC 6802 TaxID=118173 RepID=UPI0003496C88|nr:MBOAT family O-acyltransferase [Pseudanabaena sp. PCC 6802]
MGFLSPEYGFFLLGLTCLYWLIPHLQTRLLVLLTASLGFYAQIQMQFVWLMLGSTAVNFGLGLAIKNSRQRFKALLLGFGICLNLAILIGFKYVPFFASILGSTTGWQPAQELTSWASSNFVAPIFISFFTFETIAYLVDVYKGEARSQSFLDFAVYKTLFAKLLAGPIVRYQEFAPQLAFRPRPLPEHIAEGLWLIGCGAFKKAVLADNLGTLVDLNFSNIDRAGSADLWLALCAFALQIYFDFSGYVDMGRGSALLLGFNLPRNFDFPYFTNSISTFWRRWHITLGDWLRDYLYIPLGGSRQGNVRTCINLLIVMFLAGIWHGANWGFIIWGALHGLLLVGHRITTIACARFRRLAALWHSWAGQIVAIAITQFFVIVSWLPFRLPNFLDAQTAFLRLWGKVADPQFAQKIYLESLGVSASQIALLLVGIVIAMLVAYRCDRVRWHLHWQVKLFLVPLSLYLAAMFSPQKTLPFIYFDF